MSRRPRRRLETAEQEALKAAIRNSINETLQRRDEDHETIVKRLLANLDNFTGGGDGSGH